MDLRNLFSSLLAWIKRRSQPLPSPAYYDAFLSYSHRADRALTAELQRRVVRVGTSWWQLRARRLFRDETNLAATPELWPLIKSSLANSGYLILVASRESAASTWVQKELTYWLTNFQVEEPAALTPGAVVSGRVKRVLFVITDGTIQWDNTANDFEWPLTNCLPPLIQGVFKIEPLWVDLRGHQTMPPRQRRAALYDASARLASAISGISVEMLLAEEYRRQRQAIRQATAALFLIAGLLVWALVLLNQREAALTKVREETARYFFSEGVKRWDRGERHESLAFFSKSLEVDPQNPVAAQWAEYALLSRNWPRPWSRPWTPNSAIGHVAWPAHSFNPLVVDETPDWWRLEISPDRITAQKGPANWKVGIGFNFNVPFDHQGTWIFVPTYNRKLIFDVDGDVYFVSPENQLVCWKNGDMRQTQAWPIPIPDWKYYQGGAKFDPFKRQFWFWSEANVAVFDPDTGQAVSPYPLEEIRELIRKRVEKDQRMDALFGTAAPAGGRSRSGLDFVSFYEGTTDHLMEVVVDNEFVIWNRRRKKRVDLSAFNSPGTGLPAEARTPLALGLPTKVYLPGTTAMSPIGLEVDTRAPASGDPLVDTFNQRLIFSGSGSAVGVTATEGKPLPFWQRPFPGSFSARLSPGRGFAERWSPSHVMMAYEYETDVQKDARTQLVNSHSWTSFSEDIPGSASAIDSTSSIVAVQSNARTLQFWDVSNRQAQAEPINVPDHDSARISKDGKWTLARQLFKKEIRFDSYQGGHVVLMVLANKEDSFPCRTSIAVPMQEDATTFAGFGWATDNGRYFFACWMGAQGWKARIYDREGTEVWHLTCKKEDAAFPSQIRVTSGGEVIIAHQDRTLSKSRLPSSDSLPRKLPLRLRPQEQLNDLKFLGDSEALFLTTKGVRRYSLAGGEWIGKLIPATGTYLDDTASSEGATIWRFIQNNTQEGRQYVDLAKNELHAELLMPYANKVAAGPFHERGLLFRKAEEGPVTARIVSWQRGDFVSPEIELAPNETALTSPVWFDADTGDILYFTRGCGHRLRLGEPHALTEDEVESLRTMLSTIAAVKLDGGVLRNQRPEERWQGMQALQQQIARYHPPANAPRRVIPLASNPFSRFREWFCSFDMDVSVHPGSAVTTSMLAPCLNRQPSAAELMLEVHRKPFDPALQYAAAGALAMRRLIPGNSYLPSDEDYNLKARNASHLAEALHLAEGLDDTFPARAEKEQDVLEDWENLLAAPSGAEQIPLSPPPGGSTSDDNSPLTGLQCRIVTGSPDGVPTRRVVSALQSAGATVTLWKLDHLPAVADRWLCLRVKSSGTPPKLLATATPAQQAHVFQCLARYLPSVRMTYTLPSDPADDEDTPDLVITIQ